MNRHSVKIKITLWLTALTAFLSVLLLTFMLLISQTVVTQTAMEQLSQTVRSNAGQVRMQNGKLSIDSSLRFYQNGVSLLIYSEDGALMAGQLPVSFTVNVPFQNGLIHTAAAENISYLVLDLWMADGWESGLWVRGLMEVPESRQTAYNLLRLSAIALPLFIFLAAIGGYRIVQRAFRPLDRINATASAINEASDLSLRIGLLPERDEFSQLAAAFDQLFGRLELSFEAEKQFTADASHELRTPISIIKGACEYAKKYDETPEERQETIDMIYRQAVKMSVLIEQLLRMTRLEQGTEKVPMEPAELEPLLRSLCSESSWDPDRLTLELPAGVTVYCNPPLLSQLVSNLLDNAFKYGKPGGHAWLSVFRRPGETQIQVRDDGIGIPDEAREKVWQRFYQADSSRSSEENGVGLGLAMVNQIARLHGGYMTLQSTPGEGSTFIFHLPDRMS